MKSYVVEAIVFCVVVGIGAGTGWGLAEIIIPGNACAHPEEECGKEKKKLDLSLPEKTNTSFDCLKKCSPVLWERYYGSFKACSIENQKKLGDYAIKHSLFDSISKFQSDNKLKSSGVFDRATQKKCK